jgi:hypothetical protein
MLSWETRERALLALRGDLASHGRSLEDAFALVDDCISRLAVIDSQFGRVTGLFVAKGRNLALGCFSLALDGLEQEAGALFRPLLEVWEVLIYLNNDPARVERAVKDGLPSAGKIAQQIDGKLQGVRKYLNDNASHLSMNLDALQHLIDWHADGIRVIQPFDCTRLENIVALVVKLLGAITAAAINCLSTAECKNDELLMSRLEAIQGCQLLL